MKQIFVTTKEVIKKREKALSRLPETAQVARIMIPKTPIISNYFKNKNQMGIGYIIK